MNRLGILDVWKWDGGIYFIINKTCKKKWIAIRIHYYILEKFGQYEFSSELLISKWPDIFYMIEPEKHIIKHGVQLVSNEREFFIDRLKEVFENLKQNKDYDLVRRKLTEPKKNTIL